MSLKEESKGIFTRYGLNDQEISILLAYLGIPQATTSMISSYLRLDYEATKATTEKLVKGGFLKEIDGEVKRYLPLEPYFSLFIKESEVFR
jgi:DNA-binding MarR family transcriptional regulator